MVFLTEPSAQYKVSFLQGLREFKREGAMQQYSVTRLSTDFDTFIYRLTLERNRHILPPNTVPQMNFWLIDDDTYVGSLRISLALNDFLRRVGGHIGYQIRPSRRRSGYGRQLLHLGLFKARELGLERVLITCDEDNIGSKKVIEYNGGQFEDAVSIEGSRTRKLRYWIDCTTQKDGETICQLI